MTHAVMIRLEQVRGEMLERFERVDRRFAQNEQRVGRVDQRLAELTDQIAALRQELIGQLGLLAVTAGSVSVNGADGRDDEPSSM